MFINNTFTETGVERTESMDSVIEFSDDGNDTRESDVIESDNSSKEVFKSIRTRYLCRVHSVSDPPLHNSIVEQAFFKSNSPAKDDEFKLDIDNVTLDETNDDESQKALSPDEFDGKVVAEAVLPTLGHKELIRQDAIDLANDKYTRQDAIERHDSPELTNELIDLDDNTVSTFVKRSRDSIFSRDLSGIYKGKLKAFSMENINSNKEYKYALQEATSIEFLGANHYSDMSLFSNNYSEMSLFTEGSDNVFHCSTEKSNNDAGAISKNNSEESNNSENLEYKEAKPKTNDVPIVKAESLLPFPYPDDIRPDSKMDMMQTSYQSSQYFPDDKVKKDLENVNKELKLTFKAAIERIIGYNKIYRQTSMQTPKALNQCLDDFDYATKDVTSSDNSETFAYKESTSVIESNNKSENSDKNRESSPIEPVSDAKTIDLNPDILVIEEDFETRPDSGDTLSPNTTPCVKESSNPFFDAMQDEKNRTESKSPPVIDDVSYHLKINNKDLCDGGEMVTVQSNIPEFNLTRPVRTLTTFMTPMKLVGGNIIPTSPIIISPVVIQPVLVEPFENAGFVEQKIEIKPIESTSIYCLETADVTDKISTVYYDDTDQVAESKDKSPSNTNGSKQIEQSKQSDNVSRKRVYQRNTKLKPLPLLPWKGSSDTDVKPKSPLNINQKPTDATNPGVKRLTRTPEWLVDNQYYQPLDNVPFVINTVQTFTAPKIVYNKFKADIVSTNTNTFRSITQLRRQSEENVYEEIGESIRPPLPDRNIADDEKISNKKQSASEEFSTITREEILKVPKKPKKPRRESQDKTVEDAIETARITKSVISLSRTPSANSENKSPGIRDKNTEPSLTPARKLSLQTPKAQPVFEKNTSSLPREKPYWKTLEHKRLSHPTRSLNDPQRYLRKSMSSWSDVINSCLWNMYGTFVHCLMVVERFVCL